MPETPRPKWRVVGQSETLQPDATGRFTHGVLITFQTAEGLVGTVFVPDVHYNPAYVREAINAKVKLMEEIQGLGS
jgi:hypothetical protein